MNYAEIIAKSDALRTYWLERDERIKSDRSILNLVKPTPVEGKIQWVSNEPKVFYDTAMSLLSSYPARFRLPLSKNYDAEEKTNMAKGERFITGIFRNLDDRQYARGNTFYLRELAYWVLSGWYAVFNLVRKDADGNTEFVSDFYDPLTVFPKWDENKMVELARIYTVSKTVARAMAKTFKKKGLDFIYKEPDGNEDIVTVRNYWINDNGVVGNAILLNDNIIKKLTVEKKLKKIPIATGGIGVPEKESAGWKRRFGESIIAADRDMYQYENSMASLMATIMAETAYPNMITKTQTGQPAVDGEDVSGYGSVIPLKLNESIELLKQAATPQEVAVLMGWVGKQRQKGSLPDVVYGGLSVELSGFAISQLMATIKYKLAPYLSTMQNVLSTSAKDLLTQYAAGDFKAVKIMTPDNKAMKKGSLYIEDFSKEDVPEHLFIDVTIPVTSAVDKTQQIQFAKQAVSEPQILSLETVWDEYLDVQDTEQEYARIIQDQMLRDQFVIDMGIVEGMREREVFFRMQGKTVQADALHNYIMQKELALGMRQGIATAPGAAGVPPSVLPPEMVNNPDQQAAAAGIPPSGLRRNPQSPEKRAESKTRAGLVNQQGTPL